MAPVVVENLDALKKFVGQEIGVTDWLVITQERIQQFAETTEDRQWIHLDPERAKRESPYGTPIAHGFLTLSLVSFLMKQAVQIQGGVRMAVNYGLNRVRFPAPVRVDSKIRGRFSLSELKELPEETKKGSRPGALLANGLEAAFFVTIEVENSEKPCCVAEWIVRYYR